MFGIFLHDLKRLVASPFAIMVVLLLILLPAAFAWCSVAAMWNPYAHTHGLKVAVVDNDAGARIADISGLSVSARAKQAEEIDVGAMLVEAMREDESFDWQFVDAKQGEEGLNSGEYYASFVIPESFSKDFLSVLSGNPTNPTIEYWVNEKYNSVALEVTDAGAGVVDSVINRVFSTVTTDAMTGIVQDVASDLLGAGVTANAQARVGLQGASSDLQGAETGLMGIEGAITQWREKVGSAHDALERLKNQAPGLQGDIDDAIEKLADARTAAHEMTSTYASALAEGGPELSSMLEQVAKQVKSISDAVSSKESDFEASMQGIQKALDECSRLIEVLEKADPDSPTLAELKKQNEKLEQELAKLESANEAMKTSAAKVAEASSGFSRDVSSAVSSLQAQSDAFNRQILPQLDTSLDSLALVLGALDGVLEGLSSQVDQANVLFEQTDSVLTQLNDVVTVTAQSLSKTSDSLDAARSDLSALAGSQTTARLSEAVHIDVKRYSALVSSPITEEMTVAYPLVSYGAGVAPLYTCLALWAGCILLVVALKREVDPLLVFGFKPWQGYCGRLLLLAAIALLLGLIVAVGDLVLGVQAAGPVSFVVAGMIIALCFMSVVYALFRAFRHVGVVIVVVLLVAQMPGSLGVYPTDLVPPLLQGVQAWMPFTYAMGALSEAIGGFYGSLYVQDLAWLLACGVVTLALALAARPVLHALNRLFGRKLAAADLINADANDLTTAVIAPQPVDGASATGAEDRMQLRKRVQAFDSRYTIARHAIPVAVIALAVALALIAMLLSFDVNAKLVSLAVFAGAVIVVLCVGVGIELASDKLPRQLAEEAVVPPSGSLHDVVWDEQAPWHRGFEAEDDEAEADDEAEDDETEGESDEPAEDDDAADREEDADA